MRWQLALEPMFGAIRAVRKFAWLPTVVNDRVDFEAALPGESFPDDTKHRRLVIWLEYYEVHQKWINRMFDSSGWTTYWKLSK